MLLEPGFSLRLLHSDLIVAFDHLKPQSYRSAVITPLPADRLSNRPTARLPKAQLSTVLLNYRPNKGFSNLPADRLANRLLRPP